MTKAAVLTGVDTPLVIRDDIVGAGAGTERGAGQDRRVGRLPLRRVGGQRHHPAADARSCSATRVPA